VKRREARLHRTFITLSLFAALFTLGCSSDEDRGGPDVDIDQVLGTINAFDGVNISTLDLEAIVTAGREAIPLLVNLLRQDDRTKRWAALLALSAIGHERNAAGFVLPHLKSALGDSDISIRVTAAELVLSFGDRTGIPVLIDAVDSDEILQPAEPPTSVCTQAIRVLGHYTGQTFTEEADWQEWWEAKTGPP
jgi:hypothetical protein